MKFVLVFVPILIIRIFSQDIPSTSSGDLKFYVDFSAFKGKDGKTCQEFYLMIHADQLNFVGNEDKNASFKVSAIIKNQNEELISNNDWFTDAILKRDSVNMKSLVVYDQWAEYLTPGSYGVSIKIVDQENKASGISKFNLNVPVFAENNFSASSIEFISKVEEKNGKSHFEKNGRIIIPNPWRRYGLLIPKLSFYYEIYNIKKPADDKFLSIDYTIIDKDNIEVKKLSGIEVKKSGENISIIHAADLEGLNSGVYILKADIYDPEVNQKYTLTRPFEIIQIDYLSNNPLLTEKEAEIGRRLLEYFATPSENKLFKTLSLQGKTKFLLNFWQEKDPSPDTPENEFLERVMQRYIYANLHFSWGNSEGYKTDKGRILIKYGNPDEIKSYASESDYAPYEIWNYTEDRSYIFIFGDINSNGNFVLLHSTKEDEVSNYNWKDYLRAF